MSTEDTYLHQTDAAQRVAKLRALQSIDISEFSRLVGVQRTYLSDIERGKKDLSLNAALSISDTLGVNLNWLLRGTGDMYLSDTRAPDLRSNSDADFTPVPRYTVEASAGQGSLIENEETTGFYAFNKKWLARRGLNPENLGVISVRGDSMEPRLTSGDLILIDRMQTQISDGIVYVVRLGSDLVVKHIQRVGPDAISLISANTLYPAQLVQMSAIGDFTGQIEVIGRVVASMHEW